MSTHANHADVPPLFAGMLDDAAVFPPGSATLPDAIAGHRLHRQAWYADAVGPLLLPTSQLYAVTPYLEPDEQLAIGVIADNGLDEAFAPPPAGIQVRQVEAAMARRGEDPQPNLGRFLNLLQQTQVRGYAEIPLTWGLLAALDSVAQARAKGLDVSAKFRTGGLAAELFPTPIELAAVICACVERELPFKLTAGLHHAIRHTDPETGFTHHGFANVLAATCVAAEGAEVNTVAGLLGTTQPLTLIEALRPRRSEPRPLWVGFGTCSIDEPIADLQQLGLLNTDLDRNH